MLIILPFIWSFFIWWNLVSIFINTMFSCFLCFVMLISWVINIGSRWISLITIISNSSPAAFMSLFRAESFLAPFPLFPLNWFVVISFSMIVLDIIRINLRSFSTKVVSFVCFILKSCFGLEFVSLAIQIIKFAEAKGNKILPHFWVC